MSEANDSSSDESSPEETWECSVCERDVPEDDNEPHLCCVHCLTSMCQDCYIYCSCGSGGAVNDDVHDVGCDADVMCIRCGERYLVSCPSSECWGQYVCCRDEGGEPRSLGDNGLPNCCCYHLHVELCKRVEAQRRRDVARALGIRPDGSQSTGTVGGPINLTPSDVMRHIYLLWLRSEQGRGGGGGGSSGERMSLLTF